MGCLHNRQTIGLLPGLMLWLAAGCSASMPSESLDSDRTPGTGSETENDTGECLARETRCVDDDLLQRCEAGEWTDTGNEDIHGETFINLRMGVWPDKS